MHNPANLGVIWHLAIATPRGDNAAMRHTKFHELADLIRRHVGARAALPNLVLGMEYGPTPPCQVVVEPVFALVAQGGKRVELGARMVDYRAGQYLVVSVDLPVDAYVSEASPETPYLGCGLALRPEAIASLLLEGGVARAVSEDRPGIAVSDLSDDLLDAVIRLVRLLDRPADIPVLAGSLEREILWRLINGPQGAIVRQIGLADSRMAQIGRSIRWLRRHFAEPVHIEQLAAIAGMSVTSFHRHFRSATSLTPIQYQKQLRLQTARARLMASREDIATVGFAVGYDSPSQFSREYRRMFGRPPGQDGARLRAEAPSGPRA